MSKQAPGMIIGQKGVQYGLQKVVPKKPGAPGAPGAQRKVAPANVFGDDDSEEEDVERQIARQADKKRAAAKVQHMYEEALAEDPSVFDYDGVYDSIQQARVAPKQQDKVQRQSKYIASLLEQTQQRKREQDVLYERRMVKERQQEDHLYEDKERFVTSAYRRKLEEDKKWQEAERQKELEEERNDVRKVGHMGNFYANLLTKNVAFGTTKKDDEKQKQMDEEAKAPWDAEDGGAALSGGVDGGRGGEREGREEREEREATLDGEDGGAAAGPKGATATTGPSAKVLAQLDRYDVLRLEAERALRARKQQQEAGRPTERGGEREGPEPDADAAQQRTRGNQGSGEPAAVAAAEQTSGRVREGPGEGSPGAGRSQAEAPGDVGLRASRASVAGALAEEGGAVAAGSGVGAKRRNDESAVQSARERYLARKQQKT